MELNTDRPLTPADAQRTLLEIAVRMRLMVKGWEKYSHLRCEIRGSPERWLLLDADDDGVREEREVRMGPTANEVAATAASPYMKGVSYEVARLNIKFSPPTMSIDILSTENTPIVAEIIIDHELEARIRTELLQHIRRE